VSSTSLALLAYRYATMALAPIAPLALNRRALRGKEDGARMGERLGRASLARPTGQLLWVHGASVGECLAALPLVELLLKGQDRSVLVTSGTVTSAKLMAERLPPRALHQFAPIDVPGAVSQFLDHWRPDAALFVDSEIWPNLLTAASARGIRLCIINGRMSRRSYVGWRRARRAAARLLALYDICLVQDDISAERFRALGARKIEVSGSLKADAPPPPANVAKLSNLSRAIGVRPLLMAASTHAGEEEILLPAQDMLRQRYPDLLTIIAPRHPERGPQIAMLCGARPVQLRSGNHEPAPSTAIYVADTLGELGLFFRLAPFVFMGGSLVPHGGQNPIEAAKLSRTVMAGPHTENFAQAYEAIFAAQGLGRLRSSAEISVLAARLLADAELAVSVGEAAARAAATLGGALEKSRAAVEALLGHASS
jgi:3-deoxy-D-manno-octulosonic-acid transferase